MRSRERYELIFVNATAPDTEDVVVVHRTDSSGPGGHPVYADDTGIVRAEISDRDEVRMIASGGHQVHAAAVSARPVS
ncbi:MULTISPECIES: DUF6296 family protein [Streptomyces]|uniref:DUF6296 family protein n=3 Tax=Streptomyces TaxID=1883 RepID=A0ABD5J0E8_9ACTN|nr:MULTISPECIES: DUF6296 family protein [Streptomyces]MEE4581686.1 DUF6296 family protein [Streptomyces sp. DSM 41602]AJZ83864.1 hypothetical protein AS97_16655 [Streptomyces sp. AgN23]KUL59966.1 hypothetical protein ADL28_17020 [Streptomyces violaceusniger]RSS42459.1 hypothetical protein EF902_20750 [Streptomyces sp. WAC05858]WTA85776.1 DUF6296 family protein [Streptomyces antimycoticus]